MLPSWNHKAMLVIRKPTYIGNRYLALEFRVMAIRNRVIGPIYKHVKRW